ncbi:uncharacterized protein LOC123313552 isoform X1 [Coccinella septempunctata]|uniref:uncharacterized protein LOC123313552 isoform X1 n=1 Tax=Coccinella septempunctata TaxID=41139 RepID=UPI001D06A634|nr:uncharacterized protein LOC123313552 isoform X1 [Coccinella septempunctata]
MRELGRLFRTFCSDKHSKWAFEVANVQDFLNEIVHESTGYSPNELQCGTERVRLLPKSLHVSGCYSKTEPPLEVKLRLAEATLSKRAERRALRSPGGRFVSFMEGDLVLLKANNTSSSIKTEIKKFLLLFEGPYVIRAKIRDHTYLLCNPENGSERGIFHVSHLKPYNR